MKNPKEPSLYVVKAFTHSVAGGNAAGVVLHADLLTQSRKQEIAANLGLSETAFVSASSVGDAKVEFFTPNRQIPHCGHATVATFGLLMEKGLVQEPGAVKESVEGPRQITLRGGKIYQGQLAPVYKKLSATGVTAASVAASIGLPTDYLFSVEPHIVSTGISFLLLQVQSEAQLKGLQPDQELIAAISEKLGLVGYYVFTTAVSGADATTRMFAPAYGIPEEAATGMAAGQLACFLHDMLTVRKTEYLIFQGYLMQPPSPSQLEVQLQLNEQGQITALQAGGSAVIVQQLPLP